MIPRQVAGVGALFAVVIAVAAVGGVGAAWLLYESSQSSPSATTAAATQPALAPAGPTTRPVLMEPAKGVTLTGRAICGSCYLGIGPFTRHPVVLETEQPYRTFLLAENDTLKEIEAITGACAAGDLQLTATGDVLVVNGANVLHVRSFTHRALDAAIEDKPPS